MYAACLVPPGSTYLQQERRARKAKRRERRVELSNTPRALCPCYGPLISRAQEKGDHNMGARAHPSAILNRFAPTRE